MSPLEKGLCACLHLGVSISCSNKNMHFSIEILIALLLPQVLLKAQGTDTQIVILMYGHSRSQTGITLAFKALE